MHGNSTPSLVYWRILKYTAQLYSCDYGVCWGDHPQYTIVYYSVVFVLVGLVTPCRVSPSKILLEGFAVTYSTITLCMYTSHTLALLLICQGSCVTLVGLVGSERIHEVYYKIHEAIMITNQLSPSGGWRWVDGWVGGWVGGWVVEVGGWVDGWVCGGGGWVVVVGGGSVKVASH